MTAVPLPLPIDEAFLVECFGAAVVGRGRQCLHSGRVRAAEAQDDGTVVAAVTGSNREHYRVQAFQFDDGWAGDCTCPVGEDCKHVVAALLSLASAAPAGRPAGRLSMVPATPRPAWETALADLAPARDPQPAAVPLGLQFEVNPATGRTGHPVPVQVRLRPVVPGKQGRWVRSGVTWRDLPFEHGPHRRVARHREVLVELYRAAQAAGSGSFGYYGSMDAVFLDDVGQQVWQLLDEARRAGVAFVPARSTSSRVVLEPPAPLRVHVARAGAGDDLVLTAVADRIGGSTPVSELTLVGEPVHGGFVDGPDELTLVPFAERLAPPLSRMLRRYPRLDVPAADVPRVAAEFLPALQRMVEVVSPDGSVEVAAVQPPRLAVTVTHGPGAALTLDWSFWYPADDGPTDDGSAAGRRVPLAGHGDPARDAVTEAELLTALTLPDGIFPQLRRPTLDRSLAPHVELREMDAARCCDQLLPMLTAQQVQLLEVGDRPDYRAAVDAPVISVSATDTGDTDWYDLGVTVTVDGQDVPFAHLFAALARKQEVLFLPSGTWFRLDAPEFATLARLIEEAGALRDPQKPAARINRWQAGLWGDLTQLGVVAAQSTRWLENTAALLDLTELPTPALPGGLQAQLRPYQADGYRWLSFLWDHDLGGVLADDMGLGKTLQTLALLARARQRGDLTEPALVVAPTSVVGNWVREAARFTPDLRVVAIEQTDAKAGRTLAERTADADLVITSYTLLRLDQDAYESLAWRALLLDEAQFVKNRQAKAYRAARVLRAPFKLAVTGTPMENSLMDLWSLLSITAPGLFPDAERFNEQWRRPIERGTDPTRLATLRRRIRPLMLRRTKELVAADLPAKQEQVLTVPLNPRHEKVYRTVLQRERRKVLRLIADMDGNRFEILRSLTMLRQLALDPVLADPAHADIPASKTEAFLDRLREVLAEGHSVLVFSQFTSYLTRIREQLHAEGIEHAYLDGSTTRRAEVVQRFTDGEVPLFLISLKAGGFGLNLTAADYVFVLDPWWNPAAEAQAVDRAHRIGQTRTVMVYRLVAADTIEEKVMQLKARKQAIFDSLVDDDGVLSAPLTADDVRGLFS